MSATDKLIIQLLDIIGPDGLLKSVQYTLMLRMADAQKIIDGTVKLNQWQAKTLKQAIQIKKKDLLIQNLLKRIRELEQIQDEIEEKRQQEFYRKLQ